MLLVTADNEFERDTEEYFDRSVKASPKKKTKQGVLHYIEDDDDNEVKTKTKLLRVNVNLKWVPILSNHRTKKHKRPNKLMLHCQRGGMV